MVQNISVLAEVRQTPIDEAALAVCIAFTPYANSSLYAQNPAH